MVVYERCFVNNNKSNPESIFIRDAAALIFIDTDVNFENGAHNIRFLVDGGVFIMHGGVFTTDTNVTGLTTVDAGKNSKAEFIGVDFTSAPTSRRWAGNSRSLQSSRTGTSESASSRMSKDAGAVEATAGAHIP